jgi:hypothetical protein
MMVCADVIVEVVKTINASGGRVRPRPDTTFGEQITRTLPF